MKPITQTLNNAVRAITVDGTRGKLWGVYFAPPEPTRLGDILVAPPFGEEMNRCRAMVAAQARALARLGVGTLVLDLFGTGDSSGEFSNASWTQWRDDLCRGVDWLRTCGNGCRVIWGIRTGAILASEVAQRDPDIDHLLYWQPVANGKAYFTQFLRIRIAAEIETAGGIKTTEELRRLAASGARPEVSGYAIGSELARELDEVALPQADSMSGKQIGWCEVVASENATVPRANETLAEAYKNGGATLQVDRVVGPSFWNLHERTLAPALIEATSRVVSQWISGVAATRARASQSGCVRRLEQAVPDTRVDDEMGVARLIECEGDLLTAVLHTGRETCRRGVVIVVAGGPQYRIGAHRQFVSLARRLSAEGYPVLRFDLRGMGDSSGTYVGFQQSEPDIRAAIDDLIAEQPQIEEVVLFGECESASGILFYAYKDARVKGTVLVNPWVRTEGGRAEVIIKHYYVERLFSSDLWRRILRGQFNATESLRSMVDVVRTYVGGRALRRLSGEGTDAGLSTLPLPVATAVGLRRFAGAVLILMSGRDYIAREFDEVVKSSRAWDGLLESSRVLRCDLKDADHTFSREAWKRQAADSISEWMRSW